MDDSGKRCAFTLLELLVVIAIIALLLAVVMPAMRVVKIQAKRLVSTNNLRQIGLAVSLYADANRGYFPLTTHTAGQAEETWIYTLAPYLGDVDEVRLCPADPQRQERLAHRTTSYIFNEYMTPLYVFGQLMRSESFENLHRLRSPSQTVTVFVAADETSPTDSRADHAHSRSWFVSDDPESRWTAIIHDIQPDRYKAGVSDAIDLNGSTLFLYADTQVKELKAHVIQELAGGSVNFARPAH
jgi:prepilin-type N-terminal cleavage/methylation domain-containing protein